MLAALQAEDPARAAALARLLVASVDEERGSPLDRSPWRGLGADAEELAELPLPDRIGPYRVLRELGRGGMGRVFLADEETEDFRRTVALKVIDRFGPDAAAVRRFRDEVRILASLEHPGIARFLDGGRTEDGTWFLALEHVAGEDLIAYARSQGLGVPQRVELFLAVLEAVRFAHQRGIVHRDLKPANVLVDRDGRPRLLDFGISKLVDPEAAEHTTLTRTQSRALTPAYASPEQFRGEPATPASDVYSLGVVLYELLAGRRPFEAADDSMMGLAHAVLESDPEPPSTAERKAAAATGQTQGGGAAANETLPRGRRRRGIDRDLDAICLKALRKEPGARYADAGAFAEDLRRYLIGLPVEARQGGRRYRATRFMRRHRGRLATAAAMAVALSALLFAGVLYVRATTPRRSADAATVSDPPREPASLAAGDVRIDFEEIPGMTASEFYRDGSDIPTAALLGTTLQRSTGVSFRSTADFVALLRLGRGHATSGRNGIGGVSGAPVLRYHEPIVITFSMPGSPSTRAVTDFISIRGDRIEGTGAATMEAFAPSGVSLGKVTARDVHGGLTLRLARPDIHSVRLTQTDSDIAFDELTFDRLVPAADRE